MTDKPTTAQPSGDPAETTACCAPAETAAPADACCAPAEAKADAEAGCCSAEAAPAPAEDGCCADASGRTDVIGDAAASPVAEVDAALPVVVIGAGPVGLAAAAHLHRARPALHRPGGRRRARRRPSGSGGTSGCSPRGGTTSTPPPAACSPTPAGSAPTTTQLPTGAQLAADYLQPLADLPQLKPHLRYGARVAAVTRLGLDRLRTAGRETTPFLDPPRRPARTSWPARSSTPPAPGAPRTSSAPPASPPTARPTPRRSSSTPLPDVLGADRDRFAGRRTLVVGAGHSAANTLLSLAELAAQQPGTEVTWAIRAGLARPAPTAAETADALPARGALGTRLREHVDAGRDPPAHRLRRPAPHRPTAGRRVEVVRRRPTSRAWTGSSSATGFRPDHGIVAELRLDLDPILGATRALAPLIDPNEHSCGTVPPHGVDELTHPEPGYYADRREVATAGRRRSCWPPATSRPAPSSPPSPGTGPPPATSSSTCPRPASATATPSCADAPPTAAATAAARRPPEPAAAGSPPASPVGCCAHR